MSDTAVFHWEPFRSSGRESRPGTSRLLPNPLETIRISVTPRNRERLRRLRTNELEAWGRLISDARVDSDSAGGQGDRSAQVLLSLLAITAVAVLVRDGGPNLLTYVLDTLRDSVHVLLH